MKPQLPRFSLVGAFVILAGLLARTTAQAPDTRIQWAFMTPHVHATGIMTNTSAEVLRVASHEIHIPGATALRAVFSAAVLGPSDFIEVWNPSDGERHTLTATEMAKWQNSSAYMNGDTIVLGLWLAPGSTGSYATTHVISEIAPFATSDTICFGTDDRIASMDARVGRFVSSPTTTNAGCTIWLISSNDCALSAGHCFDGTGLTIAEFNLPPSLPSGAVQHPPVSDQYTLVSGTSSFSNGGIGNDWGICRLNLNNLGQSAAANQGFFILDSFIPPPGTTIRVTGCGTDDGATNAIQQTHTGPAGTAAGTGLQYQVDTTGGNSGSPVIDETTGRAIGIHTHGGCGTAGGFNSGTSLSLPTLQSAIAALCPLPSLGLPTVSILSPTGAAVGSQVAFVGLTTNFVTTWAWDFENDGIVDATTSTAQKTFATAGTFTVRLTATNATGTSTTTIPFVVAPTSSIGVPYSSNFNSGLPTGSEWTFASNGASGRVSATSYGSLSPFSGGLALAFDSSQANVAVTNTAALRVNMASAAGIFVSFWFKETSEENDPEDGVFVSDGTTEVQALSLQNGPQDWTIFGFDLTALATSSGLSTSGVLTVIFRQRDNNPLGTDGYLIDDILLTATCPSTAQPNSVAATLMIQGAVDLCGTPAVIAPRGPFRASLSAGQTLVISFVGGANQPVLLVSGGLNISNKIFPGVGSLDVGFLGASNDYTDVLIVMNGFFPLSPFDYFGTTGPTGTQTLQFALPPLPPGSLGTLQALVATAPGMAQLSAATEIVVL